MHRGVTLAAFGLVVVGGAIFLTTQGDDQDPSVDAAGLGLETRTTSAGEIEVTIEPRQIDDRGAVFAITLDTHSVELSADLTLATLDVGGTSWPVEGWSGDGPGGHREGELRFEATGPATGTVRLTIPELPAPVEVSWELEG